MGSSGSGEQGAAAGAAAPHAAPPALHHALRLLADPNAAGLHERHAAAVSRAARASAADGGLAVADAPRFAALLELALRAGAASAPAAAAFRAPLREALAAAGRPLLRRCASDELRLPGALAPLLAALGAALGPGAPADLLAGAAEALEAISSVYGSRPSVLELQAAAGRERGAVPAGAVEAAGGSGDGGGGSGSGDDNALAAWRMFRLHQRCAQLLVAAHARRGAGARTRPVFVD